MYRRAQVLLIGTALVMAAWAAITALILDKRLVDPEGSFLGPTWLRLPLLLFGALLLDLLPRTLWQSRLHPKAMPAIIKERWRTHWDRDRITLVGLGIVCFYITYVCYRNIKSFLPMVIDTKYDRELHMLDRALFFGHEPAILLQDLLGTSVTAHVLSYIYLWFLPMVPLGVTAWMVWSRNLGFGYWFVTSQCIAWSIGTAFYYLLPTLGPGLERPEIFSELADTPTKDLMDSLVNSRQGVVLGGLEGQVQSVAAFASLHTAITLLLALMVQATVRSSLARWVCWVNFGLTVVATIYFGWHYVADDLAGILIALVAFYLGGLASGQSFEKHRPPLEPAPGPASASASVPARD